MPVIVAKEKTIKNAKTIGTGENSKYLGINLLQVLCI